MRLKRIVGKTTCVEHEHEDFFQCSEIQKTFETVILTNDPDHIVRDDRRIIPVCSISPDGSVLPAGSTLIEREHVSIETVGEYIIKKKKD